MDSQLTPLPPRSIQERPVKRFCTGSPALTDRSPSDALDLLIKDDQLPVYLKTVVGHLLENANTIKKERGRSVVIAGISESTDSSAMNRVSHDVECVKKTSNVLLRLFTVWGRDQVFPGFLKLYYLAAIL
ncbi:hypothetical protein COOONC_00563 [Cooperia oncophora]